MPLLTFRILHISALSLALLGCVSHRPATEPNPPVLAATLPAPNPDAPVVRQSRYTLVEVTPSADQRDLLAQIVEISIPSTANPTVGDAIRHVLLRSGFRLCPQADDLATLLALPLPAAHLQLGPLFLRDALRTLVGPAWPMDEDAQMREVCFRHAELASPTGSPPPGSSVATLPVITPPSATVSPLQP